MKDTNALKRELNQRVDQLPAEQLREVLDFVNYLLYKKGARQTKPTQVDASEHDPLVGLIGSIDEAPFAHNIDEELYGDRPAPDTAVEEVRKRLAKIKGSMSETIRSMRGARG